ncbi:MAG TPA: GNAT family N-acetyltransferase [Anaerolineales bacterium]|nr:GNAT family N-acetyltransferase [Anaerolineales bacterium]
MINIRFLQREEIPLVWQIDRREIVENIYYLQNGKLVLKPDYFDIQGWPPGGPEQYTPILLDCYDRGGTFWGAFENDALVGVAILESKFIGAQQDTLQLKFLHVSREYRRQRLGMTLFNMAVKRARTLGAKRLYISATPSENTVNYYLRLGCVLASEIDPGLFALEPEDIHLEYAIS